VPTLLETLRRVLGLRCVALLHEGTSGSAIEASAGASTTGGEPDQSVALDDVHTLQLFGGPVGAGDQRILDAFVAEIAAAIDVEELSAEVSTVSALVASRDTRAALLVSTGRDLQATASQLRPATAGVDQGVPSAAAARTMGNRLALLGADLVDLGRIEGGGLVVSVENVVIGDILAAVVREPCVAPGRVEIDTQADLPLVSADPSLLRRALVQAVLEAIDAAPADAPVRIVAGAVWPGVDIRVIDRRRRHAETDGVEIGTGTGAFVAQAFVLAMRGRVEIEETPGGGVTLVMRLPGVDGERLSSGAFDDANRVAT
jgi:two-component system sensor histidine kinase KdpD